MQSNNEQIRYCNLLKTAIKEKYKDIKNIKCPVLKKTIIFNSIGFRHLLYKQDGTVRDVNEIIYKLTLFPLAVPTIQKAVSIKEERNIKIRYRRNNKSLIKTAKTYALVAKVGKKNPILIRVILLRIGNGNTIFYSIMKD